jgi:hypothetical protein
MLGAREAARPTAAPAVTLRGWRRSHPDVVRRSDSPLVLLPGNLRVDAQELVDLLLVQRLV